MEECTDGYVAFAMEQVELARQECADPVVLIEQRLESITEPLLSLQKQ